MQVKPYLHIIYCVALNCKVALHTVSFMLRKEQLGFNIMLFIPFNFNKKLFINYWSCSVFLPLPFSTIMIASHTRGDFGIVPGRNVIHGSDAVESGEREVDCNSLTNILFKGE